MTKDVLCDVIGFAHGVTRMYLKDFSDADLLVRPLPNMNHTAWQLGHLIRSERGMMLGIGATMPELPASFAENHDPDSASSDDASLFLGKEAYLELWETVRAATLTALDAMSEDELAEPAPAQMVRYATTVASVFRHIGTHELMHVGQLSAVRRKLNKPTLV